MLQIKLTIQFIQMFVSNLANVNLWLFSSLSPWAGENMLSDCCLSKKVEEKKIGLAFWARTGKNQLSIVIRIICSHQLKLLQIRLNYLIEYKELECMLCLAQQFLEAKYMTCEICSTSVLTFS